MDLEQQILERAKNQTASERKKLEDQKYQERLPWESKHISPYIPKLDKIGFKNDYYLPETYNYELVKSFQPFLKSQINPIRQGEEDYTEYIKNLDEEEQARFTMDKFREFLAEKSKPQLSTESGLMNIRYRNRLLNILDLYQQGKLSSVKALQNLNQIQQASSNPNYVAAAPATQQTQNTPSYLNVPQINQSINLQQQTPQQQTATPYNQLQYSNARGSNQLQPILGQSSISPISQIQSSVSQGNTPLQQQLIQPSYQPRPSNSFGSVAARALNQQIQQQIPNIPINQVQASPSLQMKSPQQFSQIQQAQQMNYPQQDYLLKGSQVNQQPQQYQNFIPVQQYQQQQQGIVFAQNDVFNQQLHYDYEKILKSEGKLKQGQEGQSWNQASESYLQKLFEWDNDSDNWIQDQLLLNKHIQTQFFLQPRVYRQVRPIDKIKREVIKTTDGQLIPFESVIERRSVEIMHQRDFLVKPSLIPNIQGELEIVHDVFSYDRSFIVEQNPITKSEILHEYPIHLNEDQFFDFLFQTGIDVKRMDYFIQQPAQQFNQTIKTAEFAQQYMDPQAYQFYQQLQQQQEMQNQNILSSSTLNNIPNRTKQKKTTKKANQQHDQTQTFDYERKRKEELKKYFTEDQQTQKIQRNSNNYQEIFDYNESKINIAYPKESQISFDQEIGQIKNL
ncbi:hypothetical protein TTHERM_00780680 (macronuclear) [Tetrahymena thermophila SB210]|uniref:Uncharacterized protein n=1 Tax=Tetrahymena thermophila (strain SB210) TaxID=312017 RepID=I7M493_TETTS|nr:hypothetical protein TTHERM_00780680 [Tetrahymena thermophila SB210]EAS05979.1 hypothetical protein TTHERM_00780680 [Tetrahymena thermophila SB210]|eukprot:XP_001026224.1 hypothetical protein TTHERM_00780680 [Tetrahymena thermophila SB210]